jgi:hypothetical protein
MSTDKTTSKPVRGTSNANERGCPLDGKPIHAKGYCRAHYFKLWRYGTPTPVHPPPAFEDLTGQRFGALTVVEREGKRWRCQCDCGGTTIAWLNNLKSGNHLTCGDRATHRRRPDAGYTAAHDRVTSDRGHARDYPCADCGGPARHWCYDRDDPNERLAEGLSARPVPYSLDPAYYTPRCVSCHKLFDLAHIGQVGKHKRGCLHCRLVADYRLARHAAELLREATTGAYRSEVEEYDDLHPLPTFKKWLIASRGVNDELEEVWT